jgi:hypothetical protein
MPDKSFDEETLRLFLQRLNASEIIELFVIPMVSSVAKNALEPDKTFHDLTMEMAAEVRAYLVLHDRENLRDYPAVAQRKVFSLLLNATTGPLKGDIFENTFKDWVDSGQTFNQWRNS